MTGQMVVSREDASGFVIADAARRLNIQRKKMHLNAAKVLKVHMQNNLLTKVMFVILLNIYEMVIM